jgi:CRP-like cAMP-binding protein
MMFKKVIDQVLGHSPKQGRYQGPQTELEPEYQPNYEPLPTSADLAAEMLCAPAALTSLTFAQAQIVVRYMQPYLIPEGTVIFKEGDKTDTSFMLLIIKGDITVETKVVNRQSPDTLTVLGPGSLVGEMALFDGHARSATCTASADVRCAILTRDALEKLTQNDPPTAARLMIAIAHRLAERLRDSDEKIRLYSHLVRTMQQEIDVLMR